MTTWRRFTTEDIQAAAREMAANVTRDSFPGPDGTIPLCPRCEVAITRKDGTCYVCDGPKLAPPDHYILISHQGGGGGSERCPTWDDAITMAWQRLQQGYDRVEIMAVRMPAARG